MLKGEVLPKLNTLLITLEKDFLIHYSLKLKIVSVEITD